MPTITRLAEYSARGTLVKPLLHQFAMSDAPASINIMVERPVIRGHDGWFHASQHPLLEELELYQWMTRVSEPEDMSYTARMSVIFGSCAHGIFEAFLAWAGIAEPLPKGDCPACGRPYRPLRARPSFKYCTEHGFRHEGTRARCHLDSILNLGDGTRRGFDYKTIHQFGLRDVKDMDLRCFREKWPHYWAQGQECMRLSGLREYVFLFMTLGNPWDTREFHVPFDPEFAVETEEKYLRVISHLERGVPIVA
jgi:hypothetical protein